MLENISLWKSGNFLGRKQNRQRESEEKLTDWFTRSIKQSMDHLLQTSTGVANSYLNQSIDRRIVGANTDFFVGFSIQYYLTYFPVGLVAE